MQLEIDALKEAAAWPGAGQRTIVVLASQLMAAELDQEGFEYFAARSDTVPADALSLALAGAFESRLAGRTEQAIAKLDTATGLDLGLPHYFRGTSLARLPGCAGRAETVATDLEFVLAVKDQFPPGLLRAAYEGLSRAYEILGRTQEAEAARSHGHAGLTDTYAIETFPGLLAALRDLDDTVRTGITSGQTLAEILHLNHLPQVLKDHPSAVIPYLVTRDHFIQRVHRQRTGYWHPRGDGVEHFTPAELAAAADLLGGGTAAAFHTAGAELTRRGEHALALRIIDLGLLSHPGTPGLLDLRQSVLHRLVERNQLLNPFKFAYYAGLADLELAPPG